MAAGDKTFSGERLIAAAITLVLTGVIAWAGNSIADRNSEVAVLRSEMLRVQGDVTEIRQDLKKLWELVISNARGR